MTAASPTDEARELLAAAERDRLALEILADDPRAPIEIVLFLAQQSIEKAIKSVLAHRQVAYRRTHDLVLLERLLGPGSALPVTHELLVRLAPYAVEFRYVGVSAPIVTLQEAVAAAAAAAAWARSVSGAAP